MNNKIAETEEFYKIDVSRIFKALWHRIWVVILAGLLAAAIGFSLAAFVVAPQYSSSVRLYVNNSKENSTGTSISSSDITASQSLVRTYGVILRSRTTLEGIISSAGVEYTTAELSEMIKASPVDNTEVMQVTVKCGDPKEAEKIAKAVCVVLPDKIADIIDGANMTIVDNAEVESEKVSPSIALYIAVAFALGVFVSAAVITAHTLLDDRIYDEEYILQNYDCPVLAKIPDLVSTRNKKKYGYYYRHKDSQEN
ncbi:MAG: hypothetical protein IKY62_00615 [Clostridia bacterium]|nr:hypothetical protein [Clostridia bacterium]